jgi:CspA family cold shock protein
MLDQQLMIHSRRQTSAAAEPRTKKPEPAHAGRVIMYSSVKKYGFVARGGDIFVHASELRKAGIDNLNRGDRLRFDIEPDKRRGRPTAVNLKLVA